MYANLKKTQYATLDSETLQRLSEEHEFSFVFVDGKPVDISDEKTMELEQFTR